MTNTFIELFYLPESFRDIELEMLVISQVALEVNTTLNLIWIIK